MPRLTLTVALYACVLAGSVIPLDRAAAAPCADLTFACLHPQFLKSERPAYWQHASPISPAPYNPAHNDYIARFTSPSGKHVAVVVKSPVTTSEYDVPPISAKESVSDYLNKAFFDAKGKLRTRTIIKFPKDDYRLAWPLRSDCDQGFNWLLPSGLSDVVIDGQGASIAFSGLCNGVGLWSATRVVFKNFKISWPDLQLSAVGTVTAAGAATFTVHIDPIASGPAPRWIASTFAWDTANNHNDLIHWRDDTFYGDGVSPANNSAPYRCAEAPERQATAGCTLSLATQGAAFKRGQSVVLHFYNYGSAIAVQGQDITFDSLTLQNAIGTGYALWGGRGLRVTNSILTRLPGAQIGAEGNASAEFGSVSGDVVFDHDFFGYSGDDGFQLNWNIVQYGPDKVTPVSPVMPAYAFNPAFPARFAWPYLALAGDTFVLYDNDLTYAGVRLITSVSGSGAPFALTLDKPIGKALLAHGFIGGDLTQFAGARYVVSDNIFQYTQGRALLLQTPFGLVDGNCFAGQTQRQLYLMSSLYWGEGGSAQELTISNNVFDARGHGGAAPNQQGGDFLPIDMAAEPASPYQNFGPEVTGSAGQVAPSVNQNIVVAKNIFISDRVTDVVNLSAANNIVFSGNTFLLDSSGRSPASDQYPIAIHDASNIYFDTGNRFSPSWLRDASCKNSRLLQLSSPSPDVSFFSPFACAIDATSTGISLLRGS